MHDALLDLVFVEDRAYRLTVGRGLGRTHGPAARAGCGRSLAEGIVSSCSRRKCWSTRSL